MKSARFLLCLLPALAMGQATHEETIVRSAYARLSYSIDQLPVSRLAMEAGGVPVPREVASLSSNERIAAAHISISLRDFVVGNAKELLSRKVADTIQPMADRLDIVSGVHSLISNKQEFHWYEPIASWAAAEPPAPGSLEALTVADFLKMQWQGKNVAAWQSYVSYLVTVNYKGKTVGPYKALFIFGHDTKGGEVVEPEDSVIDATALAGAMAEPLYAGALTSDRLKDVPAVRDWVDAKQQSANCYEAQGVCCDLGRLECGPDAAIVEKARKGGSQ